MEEASGLKRHNPDIIDYMGYSRVVISYKHKNNILSVNLRNQLESGFLKRGYAVEATWSHIMTNRVRIYTYLFSGYGQSLIEYNHRTNAIGC